MLIILKQDDSCQVAQTTCTTNSLEIRYKDYSVLKKTLDLNTKSINSNSCIELIIYGTHGNEKEICKLTKPDIKVPTLSSAFRNPPFLFILCKLTVTKVRRKVPS